MRFYSLMWQEGNYHSTATVLAFNGKKARAAYPLQCARRVEPINVKSKNELTQEGFPALLMLWDADNPSKFYKIGYL